MKTVRLITCTDLMEAHLIKDQLNNEGIECFLTNQNFTNLMPIYNNMLGSGIQIIINENNLVRASELISDKLEPNNADLICPHCGSNEIGLGIGKRNGFKFFSILISILTMLPFGNIKPKYYCIKCKEEIN